MESKILAQTEIPFPALTICPDDENYSDKNDNFWRIVRNFHIRWTEVDENGTLSEKFEQDSYNAGQFHFEEQHHYKYGKCHTFWPPKDLRARAIYYYKFSLYVRSKFNSNPILFRVILFL